MITILFAVKKMYTWLAVVISLLSLCLAQENCSIIGLPKGHKKIGNVFIVQSDNDSVELALSCRCSLYQPFWQVYEVETQELQRVLIGDLKCQNTTDESALCDKDIGPFLHEEIADIYLLNSYTFTITEPTVLMCYSSFVRQTVIVSVSSGDDDDDFDRPQQSLKISTTSTIISTTTASTFPIRVSNSTSAPTTRSHSTSNRAESTSTTSDLPATSTSTQSSDSTQHILMSSSTITLMNSPVFTTEVVPEVSAAEKLIEKVGTPVLIAVPVIVILLLLNIVFIITIICIKAKKHSKVDDDIVEIPTSKETVGRCSHSLDRLLPNSISVPPTYSNNRNSNNNSNIRTSQSAFVITNASVID